MPEDDTTDQQATETNDGESTGRDDGTDGDGTPRRAATFECPDGRAETVFHVERHSSECIYTVCEYRTVEAFREAIEGASYVGQHAGVEQLPPVPEFDERALSNAPARPRDE